MAVVLVVVGANYLAQVPYAVHQHYFTRLQLVSFAPMGLAFVWFLAGYLLLARGMRLGYWLLLSNLLTMVGFYLHNVLVQALNGFNPLFFLRDSDPLVGTVLAIGHVNLVAGAYFIYYLARHYQTFVSIEPQSSGRGSQAA
jgi:hypothetical protein